MERILGKLEEWIGNKKEEIKTVVGETLIQE